MRVIELAKRGPRSFPDFVEGVDVAGAFEIEDDSIRELESMYSNARRLRSELFEHVRSIVYEPRRTECVKLRVPWTEQLQAALEEAFGPEAFGEYFWSQKHRDWVFFPKHEANLERFVSEYFKGYLFKKGKIWNILDKPYPGAKLLGGEI